MKTLDKLPSLTALDLYDVQSFNKPAIFQQLLEHAAMRQLCKLDVGRLRMLRLEEYCSPTAYRCSYPIDSVKCFDYLLSTRWAARALCAKSTAKTLERTCCSCGAMLTRI